MSPAVSNGTTEPARNATEPAILEFKIGEPTSPADKWETGMIWVFVLRFCDLKGTVEGLENIVDFEDSLVSQEFSPVLHAILVKFVSNLRSSKNTSPTQISSSVYGIITEFCATNERSVWWNINKNKNIHPYTPDMDFYKLSWDHKITILRQLVEWQLGHNPTIRNWLDRANGVVRGGHRKRADDQPRPTLVPPDPDRTKEKLQFVPIGLDHNRKRYWIADDSPRIYISGNPWKASCPFHTISTTREEYCAVIQALKDSRPPVRQGKRRGKMEAQHDDLIQKLEKQLEQVDSELLRLSHIRKRQIEREKAQEREREKEKAKAAAVAAAQVEVRDSRTRVKVNKPDYTYDPGHEVEEGVIYDDGQEIDELDDDEYMDEPEKEPAESAVASGKDSANDEEELEDEEEEEKPATNGRKRKGKAAPRQSNGTAKAVKPPPPPPPPGARRSGRASLKRPMPEEQPSRRSSRRSTLTGPTSGYDETQDEDVRPAKRSRMSSVGSNEAPAPTAAPGLKGASSLKPGEKVLETVAGKKRSKFWFYAVETDPEVPDNATEQASVAGDQPESVHGAEVSQALSTLELNDAAKANGVNGVANGHANGTESAPTDDSSMEEEKHQEGPDQNGTAVSATVG